MFAQNYKKFNIVFLTLVSLSMSSIGIFNLFIDPYGAFNTPQFKRINQIKPVKIEHNNDRIVKAIEVTRIRPKTILLGSSTALRLSPNHPAFIDSRPAYNLALPGAGTEEELIYFKHALVNQPNLKQVVIGLDFFSFGMGVKKAPDFDEKRLQKRTITIQDALIMVFSLSTTQHSLDTLIANIYEKNDPLKFNFDGNNNRASSILQKDKVMSNFESVITSYFQQEVRYKNYQISPKRLNNFKTIVDDCNQHHIGIKVFFPPIHAIQSESLKVAGIWSMYEQWKRDVVQIIPVWDFSAYGTITTEPISNEMKNFVDGVHYQYRIADLILNRMFYIQVKTTPQDFGTLLTPETIESHLSAIRTQQKVWEKNNSDMVKLVEKLYAKANH